MYPILTRREFAGAAAAGLCSTLRAADAPKPARSPFLEGNYAPIREETTAEKLEVVGKLPADLEGMFVRNGPNPRFEPKGPYHWFDGDGMLHGVRLRGGKASYRSRYVRTEGWVEEDAAGKALYEGLMGRPDFVKMAAGKEGFKNAANTALCWHNGKLLALWEGGAPHAVKLPSLETEGRHTFGGKLKHACTAHPKVDPLTGELMFFGYQPVKPYVRYSVADAKGVIVRTTPIEIPRAVMMHDFAVTAKHTLFLDFPVTFSFGGLLTGKSPFSFVPKHGARIGVLPRHGTGDKVRWFTVKPCYVFHTLNAYEEGDEVVLLGCRMAKFPDEITPPDALPEKAFKETASVLYRWRLDLKTGKVREDALDDLPADFPRVNESLTGRPTRFGYLMTLRMDALIKYDLATGKSTRHELGKGRQCGEGVFAPRPGGKGEDDGWLLTYAHDNGTGRSEMLVIDAKDFGGKPVARVLLPKRVPFGFHGAWVAGA